MADKEVIAKNNDVAASQGSGAAASPSGQSLSHFFRFAGAAAIFFRWGKHLIEWPALVKTILQRFHAYARFTPPCGQAKRFTFISNVSIRNKILRLLKSSSPAAITFAIPLIAVYSINSMFWARGLAHIQYEVFKFFPTLTNAKATAAISFKSKSVWIVASLPHSIPIFINRVKVAPMSAPEFPKPATARLNLIMGQVSRAYVLCIAAITQAMPSSVIKLFNHGQPKKLSTNHVCLLLKNLSKLKYAVCQEVTHG
jgi:hypothetical protein